VRCEAHRTEAYVFWRKALQTGDGQMTARIDDTVAVTSPLHLSADGTATFFRRPLPMLRQMLRARKLKVDAAFGGADPLTAVFDLTGIGEALKPVEDRCGWHSTHSWRSTHKEDQPLLQPAGEKPDNQRRITQIPAATHQDAPAKKQAKGGRT